MCLLAREAGPAIDAQVLLYPVVDLTFDAPSTTAFERGPMLTRADMDVFRTNYLGAGGDASDPFCSPLRAPDHRDLPPALIITAMVDPLHDDGVAYAEPCAARASRHGTRTTPAPCTASSASPACAGRPVRRSPRFCDELTSRLA